MNKRFAFLLTLLILVPVILAACGGDDDEDGLTNESVTSAFEALIAGDTEPAKAITCDAEQDSTEEAAAGLSGIVGEGLESSVSCEVGDERADCELSLSGEVEGEEIDETIPFAFEVVDGKICAQIDE